MISQPGSGFEPCSVFVFVFFFNSEENQHTFSVDLNTHENRFVNNDT